MQDLPDFAYFSSRVYYARHPDFRACEKLRLLQHLCFSLDHIPRSERLSIDQLKEGDLLLNPLYVNQADGYLHAYAAIPGIFVVRLIDNQLCVNRTGKHGIHKEHYNFLNHRNIINYVKITGQNMAILELLKTKEYLHYFLSREFPQAQPHHFI